MNERPEQRPEGRLIADATERSGLSIREASRRAGISYGRWRQVTSGVQHVSPGNFAAVRAPAKTVAKMARVVGITPEQLETEGQRPDAADELRHMMQQREERTEAAPLAAVPDDEDTPPPFTVSPAMQEAMSPYEAAIFRALVYAQQHHPGEPLTGDLVFARGQWRGSEAERLRYAGAWDMAGLEADLRRRVQLAAYALVTLDQKAARGRGHGKASAG